MLLVMRLNQEDGLGVKEKEAKLQNNLRTFFPVDGFISNKDKVLELQNELVKFLKDDLGLEVYSGIVDKEHMVFEVEA